MDLAEPDALDDKLDRALAHHNTLRRGLGRPRSRPTTLREELLAVAPRSSAVHGRRSGSCWTDERRAGKRILFEGAQGVMLDVDHGTYPFVTSSNTVAAQAATRLGAWARRDRLRARHRQGLHDAGRRRPVPDRAASTRPAQLLGDRGQEFGTNTGRRRRCGWFDAVLAAPGGENQRHQRHRADQARRAGRLRRDQDLHRLSARRPRARSPSRRRNPRRRASSRSTRRSRAGQGSTRGARSWADLPAQAIKYVRRIEELIEAPVALLSTSPERDDTILVHDPFQD